MPFFTAGSHLPRNVIFLLLPFLVCITLSCLYLRLSLPYYNCPAAFTKAPFAFKYTLGNLLALGSSSFLVGPAKQCRDMCAPERRSASLLYIASLIGTLISVFVIKVVMSLSFWHVYTNLQDSRQSKSTCPRHLRLWFFPLQSCCCNLLP